MILTISEDETLCGHYRKKPHTIKQLTHNQLFLLCFGDSVLPLFPSLALRSLYNPAWFSALASRMMELQVDLAFLWMSVWICACDAGGGGRMSDPRSWS